VNATSRSGFVVKLCLEAAAIDLKAKLSRVGYPPFVLDFLDAKDQQTQPRRYAAHMSVFRPVLEKIGQKDFGHSIR
jgi:hypothetical protein